MQQIPEEFVRVMAQRLKLGEIARPVFRVEVDRMAFIPGRIEELRWLTLEDNPEVNTTQSIINAVSGEGPTYQGKSVTTSVDIHFPVVGKTLANVTSEFGMRWGKPHNGIDIACPIGTTIVAPWDGRVVKVDRNASNSAGIQVCLQHEQGIMTKFFHNSNITVSQGQTVTAGQSIAVSGNTGNSTGPHCHFEVYEGANNGFGGRPVNPRDYLTGKKKISSLSYNVGEGVVDSNTVSGVPGEAVLKEEFTTPEWYRKSRYTLDSNFNQYSFASAGSSEFSPTGAHVWKFSTTSAVARVTSGFNTQYFMHNEGFAEFRYQAVLGVADEVRVYMNGSLVRRLADFNGLTKTGAITDIYVPKGNIDMRIEVIWSGAAGNYKFSLESLKATVLEISPNITGTKSVRRLDPTLSPPVIREQKMSTFLSAQKDEIIELQVGQFVYMDTLVLDNVQAVDIDDQFELVASQAKITITNPNGFYSPDYSPYLFPDLHKQSPWSYLMNGMHVGVLNENTPVRVYMGYGLNMVRIFTGLIDRVDMTGDAILTITCRNMYKRMLEKVLLQDKQYPEIGDADVSTKRPWVKSAVVQDLINEAGMYGWRASFDDRYYPDAVVEETYLIEVNQKTGKYIRAIPDKQQEFELVDIEATPTPHGWMNPFVEVLGKKFEAYKYKVADAISEVIQDTGFRSYCDRYGTYRLEAVDMFKPVVADFSEDDNLISISKSIDMSRARSHLVIVDSAGKREDFLDKEILMELKGEVRTAVVEVPWATSFAMKEQVAKRMFFDMKRICRTLQVSIPMNPALDILDRVTVRNRHTTTRSVYTIKGIRTTYSDNGALQVIDLMWAMDGVLV